VKASQAPNRHRTGKPTQSKRALRTASKTSATEPDRPYRCSKCGLEEVPAEGAPIPEDLPNVRELGSEPLWSGCPMEGPGVLHLWDPHNPRRQRVRSSFMLLREGYAARICSPLVRVATEQQEKNGLVAYGPACPRQIRKCHWFVEEFVRRHGHCAEADLAHLLPLRNATSRELLELVQDPAGRWLLRPEPAVDPITWLRRLDLGGKSVVVKDVGELMEAARLIAAAEEARPQRSAASSRATLYLPFDLRFSIDKQWKHQREVSLRIQRWLLGLSRKKGVRRHHPAVTRRRFLCWVLSAYGKFTDHEIAKTILPRERDRNPGPAEAKVRKDISETWKLLRKHRWTGSVKER